jgi:hypothetical protein
MQRERAPDLRDSVRAAVDAMDWLTVTDQAMKTLALRQAEEIEKAVDRAEELAVLLRDSVTQGVDIYKRLEKLQAMCEVTKTVGWLGPQLQGVLRDLGGAPVSRKAMKPDKPVGSRLAQLRDAAGHRDQ